MCTSLNSLYSCTLSCIIQSQHDEGHIPVKARKVNNKSMHRSKMSITPPEAY